MIMNVVFVIDMFLCFISAHYDAEFKIVDDFNVSNFKLRLNISNRKLRLNTSMDGSFWTLSQFFLLIYSSNMETLEELSDSHVLERYIS